MAWISVHESIDGPKLRKLYKALACSKFEAAGLLVFLWFWGLTNADATGKINDADKEDLERQLYGVGTGCSIDMKKAVDALIETGWIDQEPDGLYLHDWDAWQEQWYKAISRREKDNERKREERENRKLARSQAAQRRADGIPQAPPEEISAPGDEAPAGGGGSPPPPPPSGRGSIQYSTAFETFWEEYPRKDEKANAYKKWKARLSDGFTEGQLLTAAKNYAARCKKAKTQREYIKQAKTFLSETTPFVDFLPKPKPVEEAPANGNPFLEYDGGS